MVLLEEVNNILYIYYLIHRSSIKTTSRVYSSVVERRQVNYSDDTNGVYQGFQSVRGLNNVGRYRRREIGWINSRFPARSMLLSLIAIVPQPLAAGTAT
jgi:hypothetical protein